MLYLKKILTKDKKVMYILVCYNPSDVLTTQKIFINEELATLLIDKYCLEVK